MSKSKYKSKNKSISIQKQGATLVQLWDMKRTTIVPLCWVVSLPRSWLLSQSATCTEGQTCGRRECECRWLFVFLYGPAINCQLVQGVPPTSPGIGASVLRAGEEALGENKMMEGLKWTWVITTCSVNPAGECLREEIEVRDKEVKSKLCTSFQTVCLK